MVETRHGRDSKRPTAAPAAEGNAQKSERSAISRPEYAHQRASAKNKTLTIARTTIELAVSSLTQV